MPMSDEKKQEQALVNASKHVKRLLPAVRELNTVIEQLVDEAKVEHAHDPDMQEMIERITAANVGTAISKLINYSRDSFPCIDENKQDFTITFCRAVGLGMGINLGIAAVEQ